MNSKIRVSEKIDGLCKTIINDIPAYLKEGQIIAIGIDGPTAAGKTIFADHLANIYRAQTGCDSFVYRLDWTLTSRSDRYADLQILRQVDQPFKLEAEAHMRLDELQSLLKEVQAYNENIGTQNCSPQLFKAKLRGLYSREDQGRLTGECDVSILPGSLLIVEGHYSLRSELHKYFDLNLLLLSNKKTLISRKIARVSGYRGSEEAELYFHIIDGPSFEHHLDRFGHNATHIIQNDDFINPSFTSFDALEEWCNQSVEGEKTIRHGDKNAKNKLPKILDNFFSASKFVPQHYRLIVDLVLTKLNSLDAEISEKVRMSVDEQSVGLAQIIEDFIGNLNEELKKVGINQVIELSFTNSLHNVYFRIFPISLAIRLAHDVDFAILIDIYEEKIDVFVAWRGGFTNLVCKRGLDFGVLNDPLNWITHESGHTHNDSLRDSKVMLLSPTHFTIPSFFKGVDFNLKITGKEQLNISSSECFRKLVGGNACWVARLTLQSEVDFFSQLCLQVGAQTVVIGNYLIALKSNDRELCANFKEFAKSWGSWIAGESDRQRDIASYDQLILRERNEIDAIVGNNNFIKVLDTHIFLKCSLDDEKILDGFLEKIRSLLLSKNRLLRKRTVQFIERQFGVIELPINKIWESFGDCDSNISISDLVSIQPSIMAELYLWMSIKAMPFAILGANIYDISENSLDAYGHIKAAIDENVPIVLQGSLNALGPRIGSGKGGYLGAKKGAIDLINAIQSSVRLHYVKSGYSYPIYGIGLDHIDSRNDLPAGKARKFLEESVATGMISHIVLDGSSLFSAEDSSRQSLTSAYDRVTEYAASLVEGMENLYLIDKEICGGELNYIGTSKLANIPDPSEINLFVERLKFHFRMKNLGSFLRRPMLFIGNVGTTHHSGDIGEVRSEVTGDWVDAVKKDLFISAVLHGTTGTKSEVLKRSLVGCKKVNIAGDFLKTYIGALPQDLQKTISELEPKEPKRALAKVRENIETLTRAERRNVSESIYEHSRAIMQTINSPSLSEADKNFFRHSPYVFSDLEVDEIIAQIKSHISIYKISNLASDDKRQHSLISFCASLIEVPYGQGFIDIANQLISQGVRNFHIDVGDGALISRKFSGLSKLTKLQELNKDVITSAHLMVRDPHLNSEENREQSYIQTYAMNGCSRIGIHLRSVSNFGEAVHCFEQIRLYGSEPGIIIEVDEPFCSAMGELILQNNIEWLVVMGVRIGFGGQIFNAEILSKVSAIRHFAKERKINICIEVDGGLTMSNIGACRKAGANLFAGWSIVKPDDSMTLMDKLEMLKSIL